MIKPTVNLFINTTAVGTTEDCDDYADDNLDQALDDASKLLEQERSLKLMKILKLIILAQVLPLCTKICDLDNGSLLELPSDMMNNILKDMVNLGEQEPYGVPGGTLVVNIEKTEYVMNNSDNINTSLSLTKIGRFPLNPEITSTFELHLTLFPSTQLKHKFVNLMRKIQGKPPMLVVDQKFTLTKKKLYRSSSHIK